MNKKAKMLIAGGLVGAFAYAAGLWSLYPDNQKQIADTYQTVGETMGIFEPPPAPDLPPRYFIQAGLAVSPDTEIPFMPPMAANGCSADTQVTRLVFESAIVADDRKEEIMAHPRIRGSNDKYIALRRAAILDFVQDAWQQELMAMTEGQSGLTSLDLSDEPSSEALESWLDEQAVRLYETTGMKVSFRINVITGIDISAPREDVLNACSPEGFTPPPLQQQEQTGPTRGPLPF